MLMLMMSATIASNNAVETVKSPTEAAKFLERNISYPVVAKASNVSGSVYFTVSADENEKIRYNFLASHSEILSKSVEKQVRKLEPNLAKLMQPGTTQTFRLTFVIQ